jgi:hypothetical protein
MPIKKATAFTASDGSMHATVEAAQHHEMRALIRECNGTADVENEHLDAIADDIINNADKVLDILTTGPRSRPGARKSKGTVNPKRAAKATAATPAEAKAGFKTMREAVDREANNEGDMAAERLRQEVAKEGVPA